jgi:hypothetical protein
MHVSKVCYWAECHNTHVCSTTFTKKIYTAFHENSTNGLVTDTVSQMDVFYT